MCDNWSGWHLELGGEMALFFFFFLNFEVGFLDKAVVIAIFACTIQKDCD